MMSMLLTLLNVEFRKRQVFMKSIFLFFVASIFLLSGCQTKPFKSQALQDDENIRLNISAGERNAKMCKDELYLNPQYSIVEKEIIVGRPDNPAKFELLTSTKFLTNEQKEIFKSFITENIKCRQLQLAGFRGLPHYVVLMNANNELDAYYVKVIAGEINIGQLNQAYVDINNKRISNLVAADKELGDRLRGSHEREIGEIQRKQEADRQYYLEYQRTLNQQNQQNQTNQMNKPKQTDFACQQRCFNQGSLWDYCEKVCSY